MALTNFSLVYDTSPLVFFPGKPIFGKVAFVVTEPLPYDHLKIELHGASATKRTKTVTSTSGFTKTIVYAANEISCQQEKILMDGSRRQSLAISQEENGSGRNSIQEGIQMQLDWQTQQEGTEEKSAVLAHRPTSTLKHSSIISPGAYSLPFTFMLPLKCPSSFEGSYGQIRYSLSALVSCGGLIRFSVKAPFTVISLMDLNCSPTSGQHFQTEAHSSIDEKSGKILARLYLRQQGYVPGEMINARMEIVNNSTKSISAIFGQFVQRINYAAKRQNADDWNKWEERRVLQQAIRKEKISAKKNSLLKWELFAVPPCCPTMLIDVNIIRVQYEIQLHLILDNNTPGLVIIAPVIVGTIPLKQSFDELRAVLLRQPGESALSNSSLPLMERYPDLPLPTYKSHSNEPVDVREPSDLAFMPLPIQFCPLSIAYDASKQEETDNKRDSRKQSKDDNRQRSRSTMSRLSFSRSVDNLATVPQEKPEEIKKPDDAKKEKEAAKTKETSSRKWGRKKETPAPSEATAKQEEKKSKKNKKEKSTVEDKETREPPNENGKANDPGENSSGNEEFL